MGRQPVPYAIAPAQAAARSGLATRRRGRRRTPWCRSRRALLELFLRDAPGKRGVVITNGVDPESESTSATSAPAPADGIRLRLTHIGNVIERARPAARRRCSTPCASLRPGGPEIEVELVGASLGFAGPCPPRPGRRTASCGFVPRCRRQRPCGAVAREPLRAPAQRARVPLRRVDEGVRVRPAARATDLAQLRRLRRPDSSANTALATPIDLSRDADLSALLRYAAGAGGARPRRALRLRRRALHPPGAGAQVLGADWTSCERRAPHSVLRCPLAPDLRLAAMPREFLDPPDRTAYDDTYPGPAARPARAGHGRRGCGAVDRAWTARTRSTRRASWSCRAAPTC